MAEGKDKRLKSLEIIDEAAEATKKSSAYVLPVNGIEADLIVIDDEGEKRTIRSGGGDRTWVHDQFQPSTLWVIPHLLNKIVSVTIQDTAGSEVVS